MISDFRRRVNEICALLEFYAAFLADVLRCLKFQESVDLKPNLTEDTKPGQVFAWDKKSSWNARDIFILICSVNRQYELIVHVHFNVNYSEQLCNAVTMYVSNCVNFLPEFTITRPVPDVSDPYKLQLMSGIGTAQSV